ncbi:MAG: iron-containing alcohol dehydrogenase [Lentisphaerae bacterium]|nr:iron-containing alcohol dehydrogenase [Lentisphaerota bacterium]
MQNFVYHNPTAIVFGKGTIATLAERVPKDVPVLLLYGGGSIRRHGVYDQVKAALAGHSRVVEFGGVEVNPLHETCMKALEKVREHGVGFILAVGGGSVLDASKYIAAAACLEGIEPWAILTSGGAVVQRALPIGTVLTLPATGSESNGNSVISRRETQEKLAFASPLVFPVFSILDPETTFSLPAKQVRNGLVDTFAHVMEQYLTYPAAAPVQDRFSEGLVQTLIEVGPRTLSDLRDYDARAGFMWAATLALNTLIGCGVPQDWSTHMIGHELTAFYGLDHAESLAVVMPGVWRHQIERKRAKLAQFGQRVWGVDSAEAAIEATEAFWQSLGMPTRLRDYGVDADEAARRIETRFRQRGTVLGEHGNLDPAAVAAILRLRA